MNTRKFLSVANLLALVVLCTASDASASIVRFPIETTTPMGLGTSTLVYNFTNGIDSGTGITFDYEVTVTAAGGNAGRQSNGSLGVTGGGSGAISATGESLTYAVTGISNIVAPTGFIGMVQFDGFTGINIRFGSDADDAGTVNGVAFSTLGTNNFDVTVAGFPQTVTVAFDATNGGTNNLFRTEDAIGQFDGELIAVPEPSSVVLLGLGALCFVSRRRKHG